MQAYDFQNSIGFIVNRTAKAFVKAFDSELRQKVGVTFGQWKVIVMLVNQNGLTQKEIAEKLGLEGSTLIPIIDKMEKENLVIRKVDSSDRRNNRIYRTEKADALWDKMIECARKIREVSIKEIPEKNITIMRNVLEKMWQNLGLEFDVDCIVTDNTAVAADLTTTTATTKTANDAAAATANTTVISSTKRNKKNY
jgi:MarR family transcriptional regulator, transcriptional regulator for hemolysin